MNAKLIFLIVWLSLFCIVGSCFAQTTEEPVFSQKETLFSTKSGKVIGEVLLSIAPKTAASSNNEWILIIGSQGVPFVETRVETTLWIFNKKTNANQFKKDLKNQDYPVEVKGISEFSPFCENGIRFTLKDWDELRKQTQVSFFINASPGEKVTLRLVFYTATSDKKKTTIEDEAKVKIEFEAPSPSSRSNQARQNAAGGTGGGGKAGGGAGGGSAGGGGVITLTDKIDPADVAAAAAEAAAASETSRADSIAKAEAANKGQRIALLNSFISERNREVIQLQQEVDTLLSHKKTKVSESTIDSLSTIATEMKGRVEYWENGYSDILLTEQTMHDQFSKFRVSHALTVNKIAELRQQQNPMNEVLVYVKGNFWKSLGIGVGGLVFMTIFIKLFKKVMSLIRSAINRKISLMKTNAKKKMTDEAKKMTKKDKEKEKKKTKQDLDDIDISDLYKI